MPRSWASVASGRAARHPDRGAGRGAGPPAAPAAPVAPATHATRTPPSSASSSRASRPKGGGSPAKAHARSGHGSTRGSGRGPSSTRSPAKSTWATIRKLPTNDLERRIISSAPQHSGLSSRVESFSPRQRDSLVEGYVTTYQPLSQSAVGRIFKAHAEHEDIRELLYDLYFPVPAFKFIAKLEHQEAVAEWLIGMIREELDKIEDERRHTAKSRVHDPSLVQIDGSDDGTLESTADDEPDADQLPILSYEQWMYPELILKHPYRGIWRSLEVDACLAMTVHEMFGDSEQHYRLLDKFPALLHCRATCSLTGATVYLGCDDEASLNNAISWLDRVFRPFNGIPASTLHLIHIPAADDDVQLRYASELGLFSSTFIDEEPAHVKEVYDSFRQQGVLLSALKDGQVIPRKKAVAARFNNLAAANTKVNFSVFADYVHKTKPRPPPGLSRTKGFSPQTFDQFALDPVAREPPLSVNEGKRKITNGLALTQNGHESKIEIHLKPVEVVLYGSAVPSVTIAGGRGRGQEREVPTTIPETDESPPKKNGQSGCLIDFESSFRGSSAYDLPQERPSRSQARDDRVINGGSLMDTDVPTYLCGPVLLPDTTSKTQHTEKGASALAQVELGTDDEALIEFDNAVIGASHKVIMRTFPAPSLVNSEADNFLDHFGILSPQNGFPSWATNGHLNGDAMSKNEVKAADEIQSNAAGATSQLDKDDDAWPKPEPDDICVDLMSELDQAWPEQIVEAVHNGVRNRKEFCLVIQQAMKSMVERLVSTRGRVQFRVVLGRIVLWNVDISAIARTDQYSTNRKMSWPFKRALMTLNTIKMDFGPTQGRSFDTSFQSMVSVFGSDADWLAALPKQTSGQTRTPAWKLCADETQVWYEFTCRVNEDKPWLEYVIAVDAQTHEISCREAEAETSRVYIHCPLRKWDLKLCNTRSSAVRAQRAVGDFARLIAETLSVRTCPDGVLELTAGNISRPGHNVTQINVRYMARYQDQWTGSTVLNLTMMRRMNREIEFLPTGDVIRGRLQEAGVTASGVPLMWLEVSLTSSKIEAALQESSGGKRSASVTSSKLEENGAFEDLANRALWLVHGADNIGSLNDNGQIKPVERQFW